MSGVRRLRRPRLDFLRGRIKPLSERNPLIVGIVGIIICALLCLGAYRADSLPLIGGGTEYSADFTEAAGLRTGDEVRIAGVRVGEVTGVDLDDGKVKVSFRVENAWVGDASRVAIGIRTLLGSKYLAVDPLGSDEQNPGERIPSSRTASPYDVTEAFQDLGEHASQLDTEAIAESFQTIADTFENTSPEVDAALEGLSALSGTIASRDEELAHLLEGTDQVAGTLASQTDQFERLIEDGNVLLEEIRQRREAIHALFVNTGQLSETLSGIVQDNTEQIQPTLDALGRVTDVLLDNQEQLDSVLATAGPYYRLVGNTVGNGRWLDIYACGLVPSSYMPPGTAPESGCVPPRPGGGR
ncbi:MCE family protein [Streptomyces sp. NBC_01803]|uniref:MCE family protein n=1 Tax=Streptomyces sp. NBC_01803 TaxID=2975946 RepID=UPI002DDB2888|nr:MCE family protein [Streptomyces sp. NBC_01803]WSA43563.1 MCE family protein [Streptomyces sp. NBC_01803]